MPLYEYRCQSCGTRFERLVRSTAPTATAGDDRAQAPLVCPKCADSKVERLLSTFARTTAACAPTPSGGG